MQFGEREVMTRAVADYSRDAACSRVLEYSRWRFELVRRIFADAGMIIIEHKCARVILITCAADANIAWTKVTIRQVIGEGGFLTIDGLANPGTVLSMGGNDDPLFT